MELQARFACQGYYRSPLLLLGFTLVTIATFSSETVAVPSSRPRIDDYHWNKKSKLEQTGTEASTLITERELKTEISANDRFQVQRNSIEDLANPSSQGQFTGRKLSRKRGQSWSDGGRPRMLSQRGNTVSPDPPRRGIGMGNDPGSGSR